MTASFEQGGNFALVQHATTNQPPVGGGVAVAGFSTVGMVGVIAASHIIRTFDLQHVGSVLDKRFPAVALIHDHVPKHPVRIHSGDGIGVFTAEIQFENTHDVQFANTVFEWFVEGGHQTLFIIDGLVRQEVTSSSSHLFSVGSTPATRQTLAEAGIEQIEQGIVAGIAGHILSEGERLGVDVIALMPECNPMYPDARAAALAVEAMGRLTDFDIPLDELLDDAQQIESSVQEVFQRAQAMLPSPKGDDELDPMVG
ncbi:MAG TPA: PAC2 family protein [Candidatus Poseidoniales archaeon]|nr:PAC2 family protein [Candidatus Poseidoniales archaeon]